ncbi:hypothetical protein [Alicyclobacillus acidiphilus]|uniref:hypothetical protein n=1 Tax=Alicyclobacillus acidiphilus TaxID=182455 RepID=UPI00289359EB|nr:hypothetical protein [Alicyclobacillus acidiphilus]
MTASRVAVADKSSAMGREVRCAGRYSGQKFRYAVVGAAWEGCAGRHSGQKFRYGAGGAVCGSL